MSQSRFSIVLVGVSALLRRPLVSRLRPADGERSPWVVFAARVGRFESGFRSAGWRFRLPLRRLPLGGLAFGFTASAFRHAPLRSGRWASWFFRLPLRSCRSAGWPSGSPLPLFGMHRFGDSARRVGLRVHCFRFSARTASEIPLGGLVLPPSASGLPSASWSSGSLLPLFGMHRFGVALGGLAFGLTASDFRHAPIRSGRWAVGLRAYCFGDCHLAGWPLGSPLRKFRSAGWPSGSLLPLFGTHRFGDCPRRVGLRAHCFRFSACTDSHRRAAEARTDGAHRHDTCFTSKHLSQHVNLPHRTP